MAEGEPAFGLTENAWLATQPPAAGWDGHSKYVGSNLGL